MESSPKRAYYIAPLFLIAIFFYYLFFSAPSDFLPGSIERIEEGQGLRNVSFILARDHIIKSRTVFEAFVIILGGEKRIQSADYLFESPIPVFEVARRIVGGEHHMPEAVITIPEGFDVAQIADAASLKLTNFNKAKFLVTAKSLEGYLFPDTYFFSTNANEEDVIESMTDNFHKKIAGLSVDIEHSNKKEIDIIKMASIIEREAKGDGDRSIISGILWKRISLGVPLQVDAAPETYKVRGLPKNPISNPGLLAIQAAIHPQSSPYLYYLHDKDGNVHFAKTFEEHLKNKQKYL